MAYTTINKSTEYFNTKIFTGDGYLPRAITGVNHQPDFVWLKNRSVAYHHQLYDSVRGTSAGVLYSSSPDAEDSTYQMSSFDSDGYTMGSQLGAVNGSGENIVSWNWKAGTTSGLSGGTITPSAYSINATSGFGIYAYTGTNANGTITHGLGSTPSVIIVKNRTTSAKAWIVGHKSIGFQNALYLNSTDGSTSEHNLFNSTAPTSSVFTVGTGSLINDSGDSYIAYAFAEKTGYSKFGSYTGNGNADGSFIYTGFKPAFVMFKNTSSASFWQIHDSARDPFNEVQKRLAPNSSDAEGSGSIPIDFLSNGIKLRTTATTWNESGSNFIYMAFASAPLVGTNNIPATAR